MEPLSSLVIAAQHGDAGAFDSIVERFQDMAYASAYAIVEDAQLAEDVAQEAFIEAYLNLAKLREPAAFPGWFRRIVFKQGDRLTRGKHIAAAPLETASDMPQAEHNPAEGVEAGEAREQVRHAIEGLPEHERIVVILFYATGYALKDIAAFLEVPVTTVKKRLYDARQRLKDELVETVRTTLQEQRPSLIDGFPAKVRLLIAARLGDIEGVRALLEQHPMLLNMKVESGEYRKRHYPAITPGYTALHEAAMNNHTALVRLLLDYGANINARTSSGMTPLHGAVLYHCREAAELLLAQGANANARLTNGLTPLHLASIRGYLDIVELLLMYGACVDARSQHGRTPLHWAALKGHRHIVQLLLARGADNSIRDDLGRSPLDWALVKGEKS